MTGYSSPPPTETATTEVQSNVNSSKDVVERPRVTAKVRAMARLKVATVSDPLSSTQNWHHTPQSPDQTRNVSEYIEMVTIKDLGHFSLLSGHRLSEIRDLRASSLLSSSGE
jgi:hypothetical protein